MSRANTIFDLHRALHALNNLCNYRLRANVSTRGHIKFSSAQKPYYMVSTIVKLYWISSQLSENGSCDFILKKYEKNANRTLFLLKNGIKERQPTICGVNCFKRVLSVGAVCYCIQKICFPLLKNLSRQSCFRENQKEFFCMAQVKKGFGTQE